MTENEYVWDLIEQVSKFKGKQGKVSFLLAYYDDATSEGVEIQGNTDFSKLKVSSVILSLISGIAKARHEFIEKAITVGENKSIGIIVDFNVTNKISLNYSKIISECPIEAIDLVLNYWAWWLMENKEQIEKNVKGFKK